MNKITIENDFCYWNGTRYIYHQCQHITHMQPDYGTYGMGEANRCGGDSMYLITYPTANSFITKHLCERHAQPFFHPTGNYTVEIIK